MLILNTDGQISNAAQRLGSGGGMLSFSARASLAQGVMRETGAASEKPHRLLAKGGHWWHWSLQSIAGSCPVFPARAAHSRRIHRDHRIIVAAKDL